jgi:two-component system phosphate regulon response regulator PhoB
MSANIYIIEDEEPIITLIKYNLEKEGYKVSYSDNGNDGIKEIKKKLPDLILLDWMLPDFSGVEICKNLKKDIKFKDLPIIMLTAKGEEEDKVKGLNSGADDYITKPFSFPELLARIKALLRRSKPSVISDTVLFDDLKIDRMTRRVYRKDTEVHLGPKEYELYKKIKTKY